MESFYEQVTQSLSQPISTTTDASKSVFIGTSMVGQTTQNISRTTRGLEVEQSRRHVERLLLRLDFNGELSKGRKGLSGVERGILAEGGLA